MALVPGTHARGTPGQELFDDNGLPAGWTVIARPQLATRALTYR